MTALEDVFQASFRGVPFLVPDERHTEGRKTVTHEYVNSDTRYIEDLGAYPSRFSLTAIVTTKEARDRLRAAFNTPGIGTLVHPVYGQVDATVEGQFEVSTDDTRLGQYSFSVTFAVSSATRIQPVEGQSQVSSVSSIDTATRKSIFDNLGLQWIVPRTTTSSFEAINKIREFSGLIKRTLGAVEGDLSFVNEATEFLDDNAGGVVRAGQDLKAAIQNVFDGIDQIGGNATNIYRSLTELFSFGSDDIPIENNSGLSLDQHERSVDRQLLNISIQAAAVSQAYTYAVSADYTTTDELSAVRLELDAQVRAVIDLTRSTIAVFDAATLAGIDIVRTRGTDIVLNLQKVRTLSNTVFDQKDLNAYRIGTLPSVTTSSRLLSYLLYETEENEAILVDLNKTTRPSGLSGDLRILTR